MFIIAAKATRGGRAQFDHADLSGRLAACTTKRGAERSTEYVRFPSGRGSRKAEFSPLTDLLKGVRFHGLHLTTPGKPLGANIPDLIDGPH